MQPVSDDFLSAIAEGYRLATRATLLTSDALVPIDVIDGSVTRDYRAASRGHCDLTIVGDPDVVPTSSASDLAPYGNEILLERGIEFDDETTEYVPLGIYRLEDVDVTDSADGLQIVLSGVDRSARIIEAVFEEPYSVAADENVGDAILAIVQDVYPDVQYDFATVSTTLPALIADTGSDRWDFCLGLAEAAAMILYFDRVGVLTLAPAPTGGAAIYEVAEGDGGVLLEAVRTFQREGVFNKVIVTGENATETGDVPRGEAFDDDPTSPSYYWDGPVPYFYSSEYVIDDDQAAAVAAVILARQQGVTRQVSFEAIPNVALECGDSVLIKREATNLYETHIIDSLTFPLGPGGTMSGTTRAVGGENLT